MIGIGNWLWIDDGFPAWRQPGTVGTIDLSSLAQIEAAQPGQPRGVGIFDFSPDADTKAFIDAGGVMLSSEDARDGTPDGKGLDTIESLTGYRPKGNRWADCLWDLLTTGADPANLDAVGILVPTAQRKLELWFAGALYRSDDFDFATNPLAPKLATLLQAQLNDARELALDGKLISPVTRQPDLEYHLRIADAIAEKYAGKNPTAKDALFAELKPAEWDAGEVIKPHATTITDNFTRADQTGLGTAAGGWSWSYFWENSAGSDANIVSNQAKQAAAGSFVAGRADSDLSSADHYAQYSLVSAANNDGFGPLCRKDSSTTKTFYLGYYRESGTKNQLYKCVTGSFTQIGSDVTVSAPSSTAIKVQSSGTTISEDYGGVNKISQTDSAIASGTRTGFYCGGNFGSGTIWDDFVAADLAGATGGPFPFFISRMMSGGMLLPRGGVI